MSSTEQPDKNKDVTGHEGAESTDGFHNDLNVSESSQRHKRHLRFLKQANALIRNARSTGQQQWSRQTVTTSHSTNNPNGKMEQGEAYWTDENTHKYYNIHKNVIENDKHLGRERDVFLPKLLNDELLARVSASRSSIEGDGKIRSNNPSAYSHHPIRLEKRSANGNNHPRQAQKRTGGGGFSFARNEDVKETNGPMSTDGFHHPHVHHGSGINSNSINGDDGHNPLSHPFDTGDGPVLHYGNVEPADSFDPFVFDPDQSFAPIVRSTLFVLSCIFRVLLPMFNH